MGVSFLESARIGRYDIFDLAQKAGDVFARLPPYDRTPMVLVLLSLLVVAAALGRLYQLRRPRLHVRLLYGQSVQHPIAGRRGAVSHHHAIGAISHLRTTERGRPLQNLFPPESSIGNRLDRYRRSKFGRLRYDVDVGVVATIPVQHLFHTIRSLLLQGLFVQKG